MLAIVRAWAHLIQGILSLFNGNGRVQAGFLAYSCPLSRPSLFPYSKFYRKGSATRDSDLVYPRSTVKPKYFRPVLAKRANLRLCRKRTSRVARHCRCAFYCSWPSPPTQIPFSTASSTMIPSKSWGILTCIASGTCERFLRPRYGPFRVRKEC